MSYLRLMILYFIPGQSCTLPPSNNTTPCSWRTAPSPGIYAVITFPLLSFNSAHFLLPEFGFLGFRVNTLRHTPFRCGPRRILFAFGIYFSGISFLVLALPRRYWFRVGKNLAPKELCNSWLGQSLFLREVKIPDFVVRIGCRHNMGTADKSLWDKSFWLSNNRICCMAHLERELLLPLGTCCRFLPKDCRPPTKQYKHDVHVGQILVVFSFWKFMDQTEAISTLIWINLKTQLFFSLVAPSVRNKMMVLNSKNGTFWNALHSG